ncbi:MAG: cytochrome c biogenesis protein CcsA, partial [Deinococcus sp.]|nr:cytochrome c biogenesis protein CcsA [Deinococcus sp.]
MALLALLAGQIAAFTAPPDRVQGQVQRIMYVHVPSAWAMYLTVIVVGVSSLLYLITRQWRWDLIAHAAGELAVVLCGLALVTGGIWGKPTWGTWWTWDARLTSTALMFIIFAGYLLLRSFVEDPGRRARLAAVVGIIGLADVPIIHLSVYWWRTLHQAPSVLRPPVVLRTQGPAIEDPRMLAALLINVAAFTLLYFFFLIHRVRLGQLQGELEAPKPEMAPLAAGAVHVEGGAG